MPAAFRIWLVVVVAMGGVVAAPLAPAPARTIAVPETLARTTLLDPASGGGIVRTAFPATHLAFSWRGDEGTGIRYRVERASGRLTAWRRAAEDHGPGGGRHYSAVLGGGRARSIHWRPVRPAGGGFIGTVRLDYLNTLDGARDLVEVPTTTGARAASSTPSIVTRAEWGANESLKRTSGGCRRRFYRVQQLFVHHTAGSNFDRHPKATMRAIYWYHTVSRGWCDVGYNFVIGSDGRIYEGRWARRYKSWEVHSSEDSAGRAVAGAHVSNFNSGTVGISLMGNFEIAPVPPAMRRALARLLAWEVDRHNLSALGFHTYKNPETGARRRLQYISGHRDAGSTSCPGRNLYSSLPGIRRDTKAVIGAGKENSSLTFADSPVQTLFGQPVTLIGTLTSESGAVLAGKTVTLYRRTGPETWAAHATATTGTDGVFVFTLNPGRNTTVLAVYNGDTTTWGSQSDRVRVKVQPAVTLVPEGASPDPTGVYQFPAGTTAVSFNGTIRPPHPGATMTVVTKKQQADGTFLEVTRGSTKVTADGGFSFMLTIPDPGTGGTYQTIARFPSDKDHAASAGPPVTFTVDPG